MSFLASFALEDSFLLFEATHCSLLLSHSGVWSSRLAIWASRHSSHSSCFQTHYFRNHCSSFVKEFRKQRLIGRFLFQKSLFFLTLSRKTFCDLASLIPVSRGAFLCSCFGNGGYISNGLLLEALFFRHGIALLLRLWWNLLLQLIPYNYLHKLVPILCTCQSSSCDATLLDQGRLDFGRIFLSSGTIAYTLPV